MRWCKSFWCAETYGASLIISQLWDVCSDQEAVDLVRNIEDPQTAAKALVEHALARFSTDNLSCMVVRFDSDKVQEVAKDKANPIGVEGDPPTKQGGISEAEHIVQDAKKKLDESGIETLDRIPTEEVERQAQHEPGPELNAEALEAAKKKAANTSTS